MTTYRLLLPADRIRRPAITDFVWGETPDRTSFATSLDHRGRAIGPLTPIALDLVHLAVAVYLVDRTAPRTEWSRDLALEVPVSDPDVWNDRALGLAGLLDFMTGDTWELLFRRDRSARTRDRREHGAFDRIGLFSGGLGLVRGRRQGAA